VSEDRKVIVSYETPRRTTKLLRVQFPFAFLISAAVCFGIAGYLQMEINRPSRPPQDMSPFWSQSDILGFQISRTVFMLMGGLLIAFSIYRIHQRRRAK